MAGDVLPVAMFYDMRPFRIQKDQFLHNTQKGWKMGWHLVEWWKLEGGWLLPKQVVGIFRERRLWGWSPDFSVIIDNYVQKLI